MIRGRGQMSIAIRPAVPGDEALLANLNGFVHALHAAARPDHFKRTRANELAEWFRTILNKPAARIWIAEESGAAVGYVVALFHDRSENALCAARRWCEVDEIAVDPARRRKGIARALVLKVMDEARREGISAIETVTWSFNEPAQLAFRQLGFKAKTVRFEQKL